jgi:hypothetical protein
VAPTCDRNGPETCPADVVHVNSYKVRCRKSYGYGLSPASYSASDIGRPSVPRLTSEQVALIRLIGRYVRSGAIRFAFVDPIPFIGSFVIFDAKYGPCPSRFVKYWILNDGNTFSNAYYSPQSGGASPSSVDIAPSPGPWCRPRPNVEPCFSAGHHEPRPVAHPIPIATTSSTS